MLIRLQSLYRSIVAGQIHRLLRRGISLKDAESTTSFLMAISSGCNILTVLALFGLHLGVGLTPYVVGIGVFLVLERLHRMAISPCTWLEDRSPQDQRADSVRSLAYFFGSIAAYFMVALVMLGDSFR